MLLDRHAERQQLRVGGECVAGTSARGSAGTLCLGFGEGVGGPARVRLLWKPSAELWWVCVGKRDQAGERNHTEGSRKATGSRGVRARRSSRAAGGLKESVC